MAHVFKAIPASLRITIVDVAKTVTLPGDELIARHLLAACAANPETFEDLLLATEPLRPGITRHIINGLLHFDRKRRHNWMVQLDPFADIVEVSDPYLEQLSLQGLPSGLILFDLNEKNVWVAAPPISNQNGELKREDTLPVFENGQISSKTITYSLDKAWKVIDLMAPPEILAAAYRSRPGAKKSLAPGQRIAAKSKIQA
jgi:hypothetical protein